jgi:hypothetical protein
MSAWWYFVTVLLVVLVFLHHVYLHDKNRTWGHDAKNNTFNQRTSSPLPPYHARPLIPICCWLYMKCSPDLSSQLLLITVTLLSMMEPVFDRYKTLLCHLCWRLSRRED